MKKIKKYKPSGLGEKEEFDINKLVTNLLDDKQKKKEFKDVGVRVGGSKKEMRAYKQILFADLAEIEQDELLAEKLVVKDKVYPFVDVANEKMRNVSSGAAYMKVKIRESCAGKAPNTAKKRAGYLKLINRIVSDLEHCYKVEEIIKLFEDYLKLNARGVNNLLLDNALDSDDSLTDEALTDAFVKVFQWRSLSSIINTIFGELLGKNFQNLVFRRSDAAVANWNVALSYEKVTHEMQQKVYEKFINKFNLEIKNSEEKIIKTLNADKSELLKIFSNFTGNVYSSYKREKDNETGRAWVVDFYDKRLKKSIAAKEAFNINETYPIHEDNWEWFEGKKDTKIVVKSNERQINSGIPLDFIKRVGGIVIPQQYLDDVKLKDKSLNPVYTIFGFKSMEFGNALKDERAREKVKHFLGAMTDLSEILDVDIKQFNELGQLSIAFASRGVGRFLAHYEPGRKIINLTDRRGDGSLGHEWGHYFDNLFTILGNPNSNSNHLGTEYTYQIKNFAVRDSVIDLMKFVHKGEQGISVGRKMRFLAMKDERLKGTKRQEIFSRRDSKYYAIVPQGTAQETFAYYTDLMPDYFSKIPTDKYERDLQERFIGQLLVDLNITHYDMSIGYDRKISDYYGRSAQMKSKYWSSNVELFARAFECYLFDKLKEKGRYNNFLVSEKYQDSVELGSGLRINVYPDGKERVRINELFDKVFDTIKSEYDIRPFTPFSNIRQDEYEVLEDETKKPEKGVVKEPEIVPLPAIDKKKMALKYKYRLRLQLQELELNHAA